MENKMIEYKENFFRKFINKIRSMFKKKDKNTSSNNSKKLKSVSKESFRNKLIIEELIPTNANMEILRRRFEEGIIKEEDLSIEEIKGLTSYYKKLISSLNQ